MTPKFRAFHKEEKKMFDVIDILWNNFGEVYQVQFKGDDIHWYHIAGIILLQSTGLKDKNGKEIFEGDIIKDHIFTEGELHIVRKGIEHIMDNEGYNDNLISGFYLEHLTSDTSPSHCDFLEGCEIIGNIHSNPELLEEKP